MSGVNCTCSMSIFLICSISRFKVLRISSSWGSSDDCIENFGHVHPDDTGIVFC